MIENRPFNTEEVNRFGTLGRIHDESEDSWGERTGVVLVHGRAGNETVMWVFSRVIKSLNPIVIAPRALCEESVNRDDGTEFSWWLLDRSEGSTSSDAPRQTKKEHLEGGFQVLDSIVKSMPEEYGVHPDKIIGIGFSQGSGLLGSYILSHPSAFSKVAMLAGFIPSSIPLPGAKHSLPDVFMAHGTQDEVIPLSKAEASRDFLESAGATVTFHTDDVGHKISSGGMRALQAWLK